MKKKLSEEELQKLWDDNIGSLAYDLEEAFLDVFSRRGPEFQKPAFFVGAIAMAAGHVLQVTEEELGYQLDLKGSFNDIMMQTYNHYREHPSDEEDGSDPVLPNIDCSMLN
jgi:hypothetical protein